jgi:hypothetical protein
MFGGDKNTRKSIDAFVRLNGFYVGIIHDLDRTVYTAQSPFLR